MANVPADVMVDDGTGTMVPGYRLSGTYEAEAVNFAQ